MRGDERIEWLEADGLGGFASGTAAGIRTRRYHALLLAATTPPTGRVVLVNGFDAWVTTDAGTSAISTQRYAPGVLHPDGVQRITSFAADPWPTWEFELPDGTRLGQEIFSVSGQTKTVVMWTLLHGQGPVTVTARPFMSGRDYHSLHHENPAFPFGATVADAIVRFDAYEGMPRVTALSNGRYLESPLWYRQFLYTIEQERGLDEVEDLASPGEFSWQLPASGAQAFWVLQTSMPDSRLTSDDVSAMGDALRQGELVRRRRFSSPFDRAADAYLVARGDGRTIVAGYPWFTDWGRDTFVALRGLCLATGRLDDARDILVQWSGAVSEGMLPNRFPDRGESEEFNSVDASLWFVVAAHELIERDPDGRVLSPAQRHALEQAVLAIVSGYARGTRFGIRMDEDGLLLAGEAGWQLTWMDARVGDRVITPRIGKPVEVQALWLNAVAVASRLDSTWSAIFERGRRAFSEQFWIEELGYLADVVDVNRIAGERDFSFRPNQVLAVGGLPLPIISNGRARRLIDVVEERLLTPIGLRSLARGEDEYAPFYRGGPSERDAAYHQGTVWPWLLGPFVEAWVRVRGKTASAKREARQRFLDPLIEQAQVTGLGHLFEIADAEPPFTPKGCPFQAWSLSELLRLDRVVLRPSPRSARQRPKAAGMA